MKIIMLIVLFSASKTIAQEVFNPNNYLFDCDGTVLLPEAFETVYIYDGSDSTIETQEFIIHVKTGETAWIKVKSDRDCLSSDPNDCLVWCLNEETVPTIKYIVKDTSTTTEWHPYRHLLRKKGKTTKAQVICKEALSGELLLALRDELHYLGYDISPTKNYRKLKGRFMKEFKKFQSDYDLPIGKLTRETMYFLHEIKG